jgi:MoxR-like ATPase
MADWKIYTGDSRPSAAKTARARFDQRPEPPPWRDYRVRRDARVRETFQPSPEDVEMVNTALHLRRPLLITGKPGCGKSSLAFAVAQELSLGKLLTWPINTKSTLQEGLYHYDAVGRLQAASLASKSKGKAPDIGEFLRLGPLGTALLPQDRPRVLLIDEIDKSDIDLPNDLLHVFEEGEYEIPELVRLAKAGESTRVRVHNADEWVEIPGGRVRAKSFPVVFMTSNGEREFPPAFMRRCLHLRMQLPDSDRLARIVEAHLGPEVKSAAEPLIKEFLKLREQGNKGLATDQLLNAVFLVSRLGTQVSRDELVRILFTAAGAGTS